MKYLKTFENYSYNFDDENIDEGWKNWALALGIALSSLVPNHANASTSGIGDGIKDKIVSVVDHGSQLTIKKLEKEGYSPSAGTPIKSDKELIDSGIESTGTSASAAEMQVRTELISKGIDTSHKSGFYVYKEVGQGYSVKWISYK
jgi:hypothetical protein